MERKCCDFFCFSELLCFSSGDASPGRHGLDRLRVSAGQQHLEFVGLQSLGRLAGALRPETKPTRRQTLLAKPKSPRVIRENFYGRPAAISENEQAAGKSIGLEGFFANTN
ncbi:MAG TPA: hypothetical protein VND65_21410 [Candidatus Binatia bacterium]|nr:hypothetical protein [Candidatus Binatia bacterium]